MRRRGPSRVIAVQVQYRPIASPHQAFGSKIFDQVIDVRPERCGRPIGRRFSRETRQFAMQSLRQRRKLLHSIRPALPRGLALLDGWLRAMIDHDPQFWEVRGETFYRGYVARENQRVEAQVVFY